MICHHYRCTLLSEVIISPTAATAGFRESLDYLPGAKFWGIVAGALYKKEDSGTLRLFHDGSVCFGDAHLVIGKERSHRAPQGWIKDKFDKNEDSPAVYVQAKTDMRTFLSGNGNPENGKQPEAYAPGYINSRGEYARPLQAFSIKSAYDSANRRSKDAAMYGYYALPAGSEWAFTVQSEDADLLKEVKEVLDGKTHAIGRSRSAQYGQVQVKFEPKEKPEEKPEEKWLEAGNLVYLYADSAWMLPLDSGLPEALQKTAEIDWQKSQVRTRLYQSWNSYRHAPDPDRTIIEKGSVLALRPLQKISLTDLMQPLRDRRAEGFGEALINPAFLKTDRAFDDTPEKGMLDVLFQPTKQKKIVAPKQVTNRPTGTEDASLIALVKKRSEAQKLMVAIDEEVNKFSKEHEKGFVKVSASQWGAVRQYARQAPDSNTLKHDLLDERIGFLKRGISKEKWSDTDREQIKKLLEGLIGVKDIDKKDRPLYLQKLAAEMAKNARRRKEKNKNA